MMVLAASIGLTDNRDSALDDAYITYVYGQNMAEGYGIRYNPSDANPTEGGSSMLQMLMVAGGMKLGFDPLTLSRGLNLIGFAAFALGIAWVAGRLARVTQPVALSAATASVFVLFYLNETIGHMGAGMETMFVFYLHGALFAWALVFATSENRFGIGFHLVGLTLGALLILSRPEGFVLTFAILAVAVLARGVQEHTKPSIGQMDQIIPVALGLIVFLLGYFLWKVSYFGDITPTAYWVKSNNKIYGTDGALLPGMKHVAAFMLFRWLPLAAVVLALVWISGGRRNAIICALLLLPSLAVSLLYAKAIHEVAGGFRYGYPMTAPFFVIGALGLALYAKRNLDRLPGAYLCGIVLTFFMSVSPYDSTVRLLKDPGFALTGWVNHQPHLVGLTPLARDLADTGLQDEVTVLTSAAGIIPYLSRMNTVDWIGLNDEQLSGKYEMSVEEVRSYISGKTPDVIMTIFPAASAGNDSYQDDPGFNSNSVRATLNGRGVLLFKHWDRDTVSDMIWSKMTWLRDNTDLAACYALHRNWAIFLHVNETSPHYTQLMKKFSNSERAGCDPDRIERMYNIKPFEPVEVYETSAG